MERQERAHANMEASDCVDTKQSKQRASIKWLLSKAFNNRVPENLQEPFYRDHEDQEHLKPPICGGLANAELYCLALANMYSDPNYHSLNHWNILQTFARKGVHVMDPPDCALTETVLIQTNPLKLSAHMSVIEALMVLYAREVVTPDRVSAAAQRFGSSAPLPPQATHEDGILAWVNAACAALNKAEESPSQVGAVSSLEQLCDGTALAALVSFYCPEAVPRGAVRAGRMASIQDCLHNLMLLHEFCRAALPHNVFHMLPEDVAYMRGSMRQNLVAMLADLFNMLEVHPVKSVKNPGSAREACNEHGVRHKRCLPPPPPTAIPDLRADCDHLPPFAVPRSPSAGGVRARAAGARSACSTPERRSCSPQREEFVVHRGRGITTLATVARGLREDDSGIVDPSMTAAGRPSNWADTRENSFAGRRSRRSSVTEDSQLTVENFGGSQDRLHFAGRNPEKELATVANVRKISAPAGEDQVAFVDLVEPAAPVAARPSLAREGSFAGRRSRRSSITDDSQLTLENFGGYHDRLHFAGKNPEKELATVANVRKISAPAGPLDSYNPPLRSSRQDIRGSIQFIHGDFTNGDDRPSPALSRQSSQPSAPADPHPVRRQLSSDTISLNQLAQPSPTSFGHKGGGDGFYLNDRDSADNDTIKTSFADLNKIRSNGDQSGLQSQFSVTESDPPDRRKTTTFAANTTTWQQQFMQQEHQPNGEDITDDASTPTGGQAMAAQLNNIRLKLEEKRRRIEQDKRRMEVAVSRQRQQLGQQAFLQAVTRDAYLQYQLASLGKGARAQPDGEHKLEHGTQDMAVEPSSQAVDNAVLEQYQQSIAKMNSSLQDIQSDIARLATQQNQIQQQQQQQQQAKQLFQQTQMQPQQMQPQQMQPQQMQPQQMQPQQMQTQQMQTQQMQPQQMQPQQMQPQQMQPQQMQPQQMQPQQMQPQQMQPQQMQPQQMQPQQMQPQPPFQHHQHQPQYQQNIPQLHSQFSSQHNVSRSPLGNFGSTPHIPQFYQQHAPQWPEYPEPTYREMEERSRQQFYLHDSPPPPQRRTWAQHAQLSQDAHELRGWQIHQQSPQYAGGGRESPQRTWRSPSPQAAPPAERWQPQPSGFVLHERPSQPFPVHYNSDRGQNGTDAREARDAQNHLSYTVFSSPSPPTGSPSHRSKTPQRTAAAPSPRPVSLHQLSSPAPPAPPPAATDDMLPQNISFIGSAEEDALRHGIDRLNISSGTRTYRIPSPTRPSRARSSLQHEDDEKGFYISFDNEQPKRPKPPLRAKRGSPRKERSERSPEPSPEGAWHERVPRAPHDEPFVVHRAPAAEPTAIVIGETHIDPNSAEEMERKKERIMMMSLQRRQRADEARARADAAAAARKAREEAAQELKAARKEEQARRREAILQQYKLKKAIEEAEREGKVLDKSEFMQALSPGAHAAGGASRARRAAPRARPKTIHVDSGALHAAEGMLASKQPSSTNLTGTLRRDYYRGSQDSLAERAGLCRDSPVEERGGMSPGSASSGPLGRRGSCKTSRERVNEEPQSARGRSKYSSYQSNFKAGRKSSSLMNLCDSGLGRATPPRRAASPGLRALGSPAGAPGSAPGSGPGSLPGAIGKRRHHPDDASDVSSTHSSIMDYSGPRLYKQPTTKSNRGIMLNAVEYCVFPGAVNAEAKRRVLEEIARSESKHFLVLFRDAGCQFRALYSYCPDSEQVAKLYGTGPKLVNDRMFDKFFKYNSGSKCFSQVHTKHLTVTIDAFTIHNSLWQGKKVQLPSKKDMALVI